MNTHKVHGHGSSGGSALAHTHDCHLSNRNFKEQNRARSAVSRQQIINEPKRNTSAHRAPNTAAVSSNKQRTTQENLSEISPRSLSKTKSKIPVKVPETAFSLSGSTVSNALPSSIIDKRITSGNKMSKIPLLIIARPATLAKQDTVDISQIDMVERRGEEKTKNDVICTENSRMNMSGRKANVSVTCTVTSQFDTFETEDEVKLSSPSICPWDLSLLNKQQNDTDKIHILTSHSDNSSKENFVVLMQKQNELKAYYDSFPNIDDATNGTSADIIKAKEFTDSILRHLPSGDVNTMDTVCHVLSKLLGNEDQESLFYDSENGVNLHDAFLNIADINSEDRPFVLKLNSSEGLGNIKTEQNDLELVQILTDIIKQNQSHPIIEDISERLAKVHALDRKYITIKNVYVGSFNIVYTVTDLAKDIKKSFIKLEKKLRIQFKKFLSLKIHPLLYRPSFDIAYFDKRGHKNFPEVSKSHEVGPPGRTKVYTTPSGWTRYGLKVLGKYTDDSWLDPFKDPGNWYRAFHGTARARKDDFDDESQLLDKQDACVDALSSIYKNGFRPSRVGLYGPGVYCSPNPQFPENGYVGTVLLDTQQGKKTFKSMLQVAVNPDGVKFTRNKDIWLVPDPQDIRPYGILIKEA